MSDARRPPQRQPASPPSPAETIVLWPIPPFRLDFTVWALRRRARNAIDRWDGVTYRRTVLLDHGPAELSVSQDGPPTKPRLIVTLRPPSATTSELVFLAGMVEGLLGLRVDLAPWYRMAARQPRLRALSEQFRGLKPPRFPTVLEAIVNAVACQQLSLEVGLELLNRLARVCAQHHQGGRRVGTHAFPGAGDLAALPLSTYRAIGFSRQKAHAIVKLASAILAGDLDLEGLRRVDDAQARDQLVGLVGVGRWTAEYVLLRGLGRLHVFPGDDVAAQKSLARRLARTQPFDYAGVQKTVRAWQPWAGMVYFHLLLEGLAAVSALNPPH
ncbi:MAG: DNA-3-methyladenine glycosylase [Vicinamibacterales bacterium]